MKLIYLIPLLVVIFNVLGLAAGRGFHKKGDRVLFLAATTGLSVLPIAMMAFVAVALGGLVLGPWSFYVISFVVSAVIVIAATVVNVVLMLIRLFKH